MVIAHPAAMTSPDPWTMEKTFKQADPCHFECHRREEFILFASGHARVHLNQRLFSAHRATLPLMRLLRPARPFTCKSFPIFQILCQEVTSLNTIASKIATVIG